MDKLKTVRGFAKTGAILLKIAQVFCVIGFVGSLIGLVSLAALPPDFLKVEYGVSTKVDLDFADWLGEDLWKEARDSIQGGLAVDPDSEVNVTDKGMEVIADGTRTLGRGELALNIAPAILNLAVAWYFCRTLGKMLRNVRDGGEPFTKENAELLRTSGITLFVGAAGPAVTYSMVGLFADTPVSQGIDLVAVFAGLMFLALAALFEAAAGKNLTEFAPPAPPFAGYSGFTGTPAEPPVPDEAPGQVPAPGEESAPGEGKNDPPENPNAF